MAVFLQNLRPSGQRSAAARLGRFASFFGRTLDSYPWFELSAGDVLTARGLLLDLCALKSTINMTLSALRGVARTARLTRPDRMSAENCAAVCLIQGVKGSTTPAGRALREEEIASLMKTCARATWRSSLSSTTRACAATRPTGSSPRTGARATDGCGSSARATRRSSSTWSRRRRASPWGAG